MPPSMLLNLSPNDGRIYFKGAYTEKSLGYVQLFNPTANRIAFKVKTNAPKHYLVKPINGILLPRSQETVQIAFLPPTDASEFFDLSKHMFLLEAAIITNPAYNDVAKIMNLARSSGQCMQTQFKCTFVEANRKPDPSYPVEKSTASAVRSLRTNASHAPNGLPGSRIEDSDGIGWYLFIGGLAILIIGYIYRFLFM